MKHNFLVLAISSLLLLNSCGQSTAKKEESAEQDSVAAEMPEIPELITENFAASFKGTINDQYPITFEINKFNDAVCGSYKYDGKNGSLILKGRMEDTGILYIDEYNTKGEVTGSFEGKLKDEHISGTWYNKKRTKSMPFSLDRTSIASLQTKTDILSDAIGQYGLDFITGGAGANTMFDTYIENGKWHSSSSGIVSSMRESYENELTQKDIDLLNNLHIVVDDHMDVHVYAGLTELINCPFKAGGMEYRINETDKEKMNLKIAALKPETIYDNNDLVLLADDHMDFSQTLQGEFNVVALDNMILSYNPAERKFELDIFNGIGGDGNIISFSRK